VVSRLPIRRHVANPATSEIRNKIYSYCRENGSVRLRHHFIRDPEESWRDECGEWNYNPKNLFQGSAGKYRSLTQVCQQLRTEFRPLYQEATAIDLYSAADFGAYSAAFYPITEECMEHHRSNITIPLFHCMHMVERETLEMDIQPVFFLTALCPKIKCRFKVDDCMPRSLKKPEAQLNSLLDTIADASDTLLDLVLRAIAYAILRIDRTYASVNIIIDSRWVYEWEKDVYQWWAEKAQPVKGIHKWEVSGYDGRRFDRPPYHGTDAWDGFDFDHEDSGYYTSTRAWRSTSC
jgi:hypothetical protein